MVRRRLSDVEVWGSIPAERVTGKTIPSLCVDVVFLVSFCYSMRRSICRSFGSHKKTIPSLWSDIYIYIYIYM